MGTSTAERVSRIGVSFALGSALLAVLAACSTHGPPAPAPPALAAGEAAGGTAAENPVLVAARARLEEARASRKAGDTAAARDHARAAIDDLLAQEEGGNAGARTAMLHELGSIAHASGDLEGAERARRRVLEVCVRTLPPDHRDVQIARADLALTLQVRGDLAGARALLEDAVDVFGRTLPPDHPDLQRLRMNLANALRIQGDLVRARALLVEVLDVYSRTLAPNHSELQAARTNLASVLKLQGDLPGARALDEQALEVYSRTLPLEHRDHLRVRQNLATVLASQGEIAAARGHFEEILEVLERTLPPDHPDLQGARLNLAAALREQGELAAARALFEQILTVQVRVLPPDHPDLQRVRMNLGATLFAQGELAAGRALLETAEEVLARTLPAEHSQLQSARTHLAIALKEQGDLPAARALFEQVFDVSARTLPADHADVQMARLNLAVVLKAGGEVPAARALYEEVLESLERTLPPDHAELQLARLNLANALRAQGEIDAARELQEQALAARTRALPPDHTDLQAARLNLANTLADQGDLGAARALLEQVHEVRSRTLPPDHPELQLARENLAVTIAALAAEAGGPEGDHERAERWTRCTELAAALTRSAIRTARGAMLSASHREAEERCSGLRSALSLALSVAAGRGTLDPSLELEREAFVLSETTRAVALASARLARLARSDGRCAALEETARSASEELARLARSGATPEAYDAVIARRDRAQRELVAIAIGSAEASGLLAEPDPAALSERLGQDQALVAYRRYARLELDDGPAKERSRESLCAHVLRRGAPLQRVELGAIEPIERAARTWRDAIGAAPGRGVGAGVGAAASETEAEHARRLAALVLDPLRRSLGDARRLVVVLDDVLHAVPIDPLTGDELEVELRSTTQELLRGSTTSAASERGLILAVGGADYSAGTAAAVPGLLRGGAWSAGFSPLPGALGEARGVIELAARGSERLELVLLEDRGASREAVERLAPRARVLHLATHGWFAPEAVRSWDDPDPGPRTSAEDRVRGSSPMVLCGLALAGANDPPDEVGRCPGLVTAEEISAWDLSDCELAVLSACDTNVGERRAGQGVASLQKALHMAGGRTVITSLWKVPDEATKELMLDFYRRVFLEHEPKGRALREAKRGLREARDANGASRYATRDWAAWVLTGEPD